MTPDIRVLFRCDGSAELGMGHVIRCLALADELKKEYHCTVAFALRQGRAGIDLIKNKGFQVFCSAEKEGLSDYSSWLLWIVDEFFPNIFIMDFRDNLPVQAIRVIKRRGILVVTIDDPTDRRLEADMAFYPPVPQVKKMDWSGFQGRLFIGWKWVLLREEFSIKKEKIPHDTPVILVAMGGSDPAGMTCTAIRALERIKERFEVHVVIGPSFSHTKGLRDCLIGAKHRYVIKKNVEHMADIMDESDIAIASFGITAYELGAMGVPAVLLSLTGDHAQSASSFADAGMMISLGEYTSISEESLSDSIRDLLHDRKKCEMMSRNSSQRLDGFGVKRIAKSILRLQ